MHIHYYWISLVLITFFSQPVFSHVIISLVVVLDNRKHCAFEWVPYFYYNQKSYKIKWILYVRTLEALLPHSVRVASHLLHFLFSPFYKIQSQLETVAVNIWCMCRVFIIHFQFTLNLLIVEINFRIIFDLFSIPLIAIHITLCSRPSRSLKRCKFEIICKRCD